MNLKMKTLAAAMIAAGTMGAAQASGVLFPYVVNSNSVTTIVTVIDTNTGYAAGHTNELHWVLWYKDGASVDDKTANCKEVNQWLPTSTNDMQTVDLGGKFGATTKGVLFNDPSINNDWKKTNKRFDMANLDSKPLRGYLVIDDAVPQVASNVSTLEGEAMVLEFASGASWGYTAGRTVDSGFHLDNDITFTSPQNVSIKPWGETNTLFFVTPIDGNMIDGNNIAAGATLSMLKNGVAMYDRDENPVSGSVSFPVNCVSSVPADKLITSSAKTLLPDGGWGSLTTTYATVYEKDGAVKYQVSTASVIKLDFNSKPTFNGETVTGTFNNAFQLR